MESVQEMRVTTEVFIVQVTNATSFFVTFTKSHGLVMVPNALTVSKKKKKIQKDALEAMKDFGAQEESDNLPEGYYGCDGHCGGTMDHTLYYPQVKFCNVLWMCRKCANMYDGKSILMMCRICYIKNSIDYTFQMDPNKLPDCGCEHKAYELFYF